MARGDETKLKVVLKGDHDNFLIFIDDADMYRKWLTDRSIPLAHFISSFKVLSTGLQGMQANFGAPSDLTLETEFGTSDDDTVIKKILEGGTAQEMTMGERQGCTNDSFNSMRSK